MLFLTAKQRDTEADFSSVPPMVERALVLARESELRFLVGRNLGLSWESDRDPWGKSWKNIGQLDIIQDIIHLKYWKIRYPFNERSSINCFQPGLRSLMGKIINKWRCWEYWKLSSGRERRGTRLVAANRVSQPHDRFSYVFHVNGDEHHKQL